MPVYNSCSLKMVWDFIKVMFSSSNRMLWHILCKFCSRFHFTGNFDLFLFIFNKPRHNNDATAKKTERKTKRQEIEIYYFAGVKKILQTEIDMLKLNALWDLLTFQ